MSGIAQLETYAARKAQGLCVQCGRGRDDDGVRCLRCRAKLSQQRAGRGTGTRARPINAAENMTGYVNAIAMCAVGDWRVGDELVSSRWKAPQTIVLLRPAFGCVRMRAATGHSRDYDRFPADVSRKEKL